MASSADIWYIRLPDGRILRARSTEALRHYLKSGRIPWDSRVRRSAEDPWQTLDRVEVFVDLVPKGSALGDSHLGEAPGNEAAPRPKKPGAELRTLGMRGLVEELFNAFDSCLQRPKLATAACTGLGIGLVWMLGEVAAQLLGERAWIGHTGAALAVLVVFSTCISILTQMTALELSRFRQARFSEIRAGLVGTIARLSVALGLVGGAILGFIVLLRSLPGWIAPAGEAEIGMGLEMTLNVVNGARLILEVLCWPIFGVAMLLLGPIMIVEEYSITRALREWLGMLRQHLGRIYLYQALAFAFAAILSLPLVLPVLLARYGFIGNAPPPSLGASAPFYLLAGVALTPALAYLLVAHVFIYLNLRYEFFYSTRER